MKLDLPQPPRILASLHSVACAGPSDCSCVPTFVVHEGAAGEQVCDNGHYRGETGNDIECVAVRRSCSPRASGRSASTEVSP